MFDRGIYLFDRVIRVLDSGWVETSGLGSRLGLGGLWVCCWVLIGLGLRF